MESNTHIIETILRRELNGYYGGIFDLDYIQDTASSIMEEIRYHSIFNIPNTIKAKCVDNKVYKGTPTLVIRQKLLEVRAKDKRSKISNSDWVDMLVNYPLDNVIYNSNNKELQLGIDRPVDLYLMKHKCASEIYEVVRGIRRLSLNKGPYTEVLSKYIHKAKSINVSKDILCADDSDNFAWEYINSLYVDKFIIEDCSWVEAKVLSQNLGIIFGDLIYRLKTGVPIREALDLGTQDKHKYGFINEDDEIIFNGKKMRGYTYNVIAYIRYMAKEEGLETEVKID